MALAEKLLALADTIGVRPAGRGRRSSRAALAQTPLRPRAHLQRLHSGLRSACSTGNPHSPSAIVLSPSAPAGVASSGAPPAVSSDWYCVGDPEAPEGRGADSPSVGASACDSMGGAKSLALALKERCRRGAPSAEDRGLRTHVT